MDSAAFPTDVAALTGELQRIRVLLGRGAFTEGLAAAEAFAVRIPEHRDGQLLVAVARRCVGRIDEALQALANLERTYPRFSRLYEERGQCFVVKRQAPQAIEAFLAAVHLNHALPASWRNLEALYGMTGRADDRAMAATQVATLRNLPPEVVSATALFMDGDWDLAEPLVRGYLLRHGNQVEAMRLLARIGMARQVFDDAELLLAAVLELAPDYPAARREYIEVLIERHKYAEARLQLQQLPREEVESRFYKTLEASLAVGLGQHERAIVLYRELLQGDSADAEVHLSIAHALKTLGRREQAITAYRNAADCRPAFGDAYWSLANLKTYRFTDAELSRMRAMESSPTVGPPDRYSVCFALGKALEDRGEFAESFRYYDVGNTLKRSENRYRPEIIENNTRLQIELCTREFFAARDGCGSQAPDPIFIVGLPRSGSTLLEQILASHSRVEGTQELPNVQQIVATLRGREPDPGNPRYPRILAELQLGEFRELGEQYLAATRVYRTDRPFFIDKMPNNFRHLGLIRLMLPRAKIIDARREPMACCFGNFTQLFAKGQEFTYGIEDIARYYRTYLELMRHWDAVLPGWVLRVYHEDVVDDLQGSVRRMLEFCGLEFESACVDFHKTVRSVRPASSEQVRQPIYREGLDHWKSFEPWLGPLKAALGDALGRYRE